MSRLLDVNRSKKRIRIDFPYNRELVNVVRTLPDRRFDNQRKCWWVPLKHLEYVIKKLEGHHFRLTPGLRKYRREHESEVKEGPQVPDGTLTVSELNRGAQEALRAHFRDEVWVVGELQSFERNRGSRHGHYFFELVERPSKGAAEVAKVRAVLFERFRRRIEERLSDSGVELADGASVRLRGRVDLYLNNGSYQLLIRDIDPTYTVGAIELNRERVYRALKRKGVADRNQRIAWPLCPLRVGLITSVGSDAYNDFIHQLEESGRAFEVTVHDANVQGVKTEASVLRALSYFKERAEDYDVVVITRGGGSRSELAHFDTEKIGAAVCAHPTKVVVGVGHQRDTSLLDLIAASTKTPTAAAERLVEQVQAFDDRVQALQRRIVDRARRGLQGSRRSLRRRATTLERGVSRRVNKERQRHQVLQARFVGRTEQRLSQRRQMLREGARRLARATSLRVQEARRTLRRAGYLVKGPRPPALIDDRRQRLRMVKDRLQRVVARQVEGERERLNFQSDRLHLVDPQRVLERGFALLRSDEGPIRSTGDISPGQRFEVLLADGRIDAIRKDNPEQSPPHEE